MNTERLMSSVNLVRVVHSAVEPVITKRYCHTARRTGISLPSRRAEIDFRVSQLLASELLRCSINIPRYTRHPYTHKVNRIEYVWGKSLRSLNPNVWCNSLRFHELGLLLAKKERLPENSLACIFTGLEGDQALSYRLISSFKGVTCYHPEFVCGGVVLSLGDVGLANVLSGADGLTLLDFEFAHLGSPGWDAGQLAAELSSHPMVKTTHTYRAHLLAGYSDAGGDRQAAQFWEGQFKPYYAERYRRGDYV